MQYINLINFADLCSNAFLKIIDDVYNKSYFLQDGIVVDMSDTRNKKLLTYLIEEDLKSQYNYGKVRILINTCKPWNNWRKEARGAAVKANKFTVLDDSILVDTLRLEKAIESTWNTYKNNSLCHTIESIQMDTFDISTLITNMLGSPFISQYKADYLILQDSNYLYDHTLPLHIPNYLYQEVERDLININLI